MEENKKINIHKFLNNEMSSNEAELFKKSEEYQKHKTVIELFEDSEGIAFDKEKVLNNINNQKNIKNKKVIPLYKKWIPVSIAASILICFSLFYYVSLKPTAYNTDIGESIEFSLPDQSLVWLNAKSEITHNKDWENSRDITLSGEAYFEVAKGKTFTVKTPEGIVTVLGTKFNVKQRDHFFEVHCFEGSVSVNYNNTLTVLKASDVFSSEENKKQIKHINKPNWINKESVFNNTNLNEVLADISLHYNVTFNTDQNSEIVLLKYTGSYNYSDDLETVLKVLCKSLNLNYSIENNTVFLSK
ncbi:FecR family protein [Neotamlana laminarinivorans]|uniref:FecR family protein n=1 Tax=Neotamlana laminarinivorans TaxID=2883124 RepID=A0A9X1L531_9FLAO|nr:FecR family protein [Tamlana laminarinivorans]MCB4798941.1 FecR family protein [Tamlana laminarinivorans]